LLTEIFPDTFYC